ncbi:unnamed protein product [Auanema sp. JU1783]|nr:unnamed protein product [Auanema sp. JU1783]
MESCFEWMMRTQKDVLDILREGRTSNAASAINRESTRGSSLSLPDTTDNAIGGLSKRSKEVTSITDNILLSAQADDRRLNSPSPLLTHLRRDHILRKYDEARYQSPLIKRRPRLNSSSQSISQDIKEMEDGLKKDQDDTDEEIIPDVVVHDASPSQEE